jgi:hypothetical protein
MLNFFELEWRMLDHVIPQLRDIKNGPISFEIYSLISTHTLLKIYQATILFNSISLIKERVLELC